MKIISWNVNGFRAIIKKGFEDIFRDMDADIFCIQETKLQADQHDFTPKGYHQYWNYAKKKGYSGTVIFSKVEPLDVSYGIGQTEHDNEGRVITAEYEEFYLVNSYTPNSQRELARLSYRMEWEKAFLDHIRKLDASKPVILCGDLNVAHNEIDLKNPSSNRMHAGFTDEEREKLSILLDEGFIDTFRYLYPDLEGSYTWWSYMNNARKNNSGWRIDYFIVSKRLAEAVDDQVIHSQIMGSDHCPIELKIF